MTALPPKNVPLLRNAMTVDVEDYFHVAALSKVIRRDDWEHMQYRAEDSTRKLLDLFQAKSGADSPDPRCRT